MHVDNETVSLLLVGESAVRLSYRVLLRGLALASAVLNAVSMTRASVATSCGNVSTCFGAVTNGVTP